MYEAEYRIKIGAKDLQELMKVENDLFKFFCEAKDDILTEMVIHKTMERKRKSE